MSRLARFGLTLVAGSLISLGLLGAVTSAMSVIATPTQIPLYTPGTTAPEVPVDTCTTPQMYVSLAPTIIPDGQAAIVTAQVYEWGPASCLENGYYVFNSSVIPGGQHISTVPQLVIPTSPTWTQVGYYTITVTAYFSPPSGNFTASANGGLQVVA
ncbi:MAG TPA: hypothetical protein VGV89_04615 [Thermoplasmata archaeon]|nr:hypothetical protein [Thermoplasmata archaeon]